ncbi:uncharacterized protein LOC128884417 isoform X2 [Hylaeus volcanicus]|nr:uncharacterized protein LOC128884417 isoform X2 [Hylaeus volcanicus]XP_053993798.1 uncharacterized protein LOC128884417 isoform X2 [Hylaeus volcanicus]
MGRTCLGVSVLASSHFQDQHLRFLLCLRKNHPGQNKWSLPGGSLFWNEPLQDGALRELREETGLSTIDIESIWPIAFASQVISPQFHCLIATIPLKIKFSSTNLVRARDDVKDVKWYTKDEIALLQKAEKIQGDLTELIEYAIEKLF